MYTAADSNLEVTNCTFGGNSASHSFSGGGIANGGSATVTNCTFSANEAFRGGGIANGGSATVTNCTFINNTCYDDCYYGNGIWNRGSAVLTIKNSILADNGEDLKNDGLINSSYNIVETYTGFTPDATDITGDQPDLNIGPLADNGGDTWTHALLSGSVAINAGTAPTGLRRQTNEAWPGMHHPISELMSMRWWYSWSRPGFVAASPPVIRQFKTP
jgi:hypothetical protein